MNPNTFPLLDFFSNNKRFPGLRTNCPCCNEVLTGRDKRQAQHIYPLWSYSLFEKINDEIILNTFGREDYLNPGTIETAKKITIKDYYSNFWCQKCESISGRLDNAVKNILFGAKTPLTENMCQFDPQLIDILKNRKWHKHKQKKHRFKTQWKKNKIALHGKQARMITRWISSILIRIVLNECPDYPEIIKLLYQGMLGNFKENFLYASFDPKSQMSTLSPLTIQTNDNYCSMSFIFGGLVLIALFPQDTKKKYYLHTPQGFPLAPLTTRKAIIRIEPGVKINALTFLVSNMFNKDVTGTNSLVFFDKMTTANNNEGLGPIFYGKPFKNSTSEITIPQNNLESIILNFKSMNYYYSDSINKEEVLYLISLSFFKPNYLEGQLNREKLLKKIQIKVS